MTVISKPFFSRLTSLGLLSIEGAEAEKFLQGQLTCNVLEANDSELLLGAHCNPQGRILSLFYLWREKDIFHLVMPKTLIPLAYDALKKYGQFFRTVRIYENTSLQVSVITTEEGIHSPVIPAEAGIHYPVIPAEAGIHYPVIPAEVGIHPSVIPAEAGIHSILKIPNSKTHLILTNDPNFSIDLPEENEETWKKIKILSGIPTIYPETSGVFLPHEINLHLINGISFNKGCYTGQEIIARMQYKGRLKNHMYHASITSDQSPSTGQDIYPKGNIVDWVEVGYNTYELLLVAAAQDIQDLFLDSEKKYKFSIESLPYSLEE